MNAFVRPLRAKPDAVRSKSFQIVGIKQPYIFTVKAHNPVLRAHPQKTVLILLYVSDAGLRHGVFIVVDYGVGLVR